MTSTVHLRSLVLPAVSLSFALAWAEEPETATVMVEVRVIQCDAAATEKIGEETASEPAKVVELKADRIVLPSVLASSPEGLSVLVAEGGFKLKLAGHIWSPTETSGWTTLTAPRLLCRPGHEAGVCIGQKVPYMEMGDDSRLAVKYSEDTEGITVTALVDEADDQTVSLESLSIRVSQVAARQPIPDVPFDVGRPIMRTAEVSTALRLDSDQLVIFALPQLGPDDRPIFVLLSARLQPPVENASE